MPHPVPADARPPVELFREPGSQLVMPPPPDDLSHLVHGILPPQISGPKTNTPQFSSTDGITSKSDHTVAGAASGSVTKISEFDAAFPAVEIPIAIKNTPPEKTRVKSISDIRDPDQAADNKIPRFSYASSFVMGFAGILIGLLIALVGYYFWTYRTGQWERDNRAAIMTLIEEGETAQASGNLQRAAKKYTELDKAIGEQHLDDPQLASAVSNAQEQKKKILEILLEMESRGNNPGPVVTTSPASIAATTSATGAIR